MVSYRSFVARRDRGATIRSAMLVVLLLAMSLVVTAPSRAATQSPNFARADYPSLGSSQVTGDFNGDGRPDLAGLGAQAAVVQLNSGTGAFGARTEYPLANWAQDLAAGDFTGDGRLDLAVTINDPEIGLALLTGNGDGTFAPAVHFPNTSGFDAPAINATDLNRDARLDLVIAHQIACYVAPCVVAQTLSVMLGNGDGTFQPTREIEVGRGMAEIAPADFNRDGIIDLAVAGDSSRVYLLRGVGDGTFVQLPTITLTSDTLGVDATDIDAADFNGDAVLDLVVAIALNGSRTAVLLGNGDGTFGAPLILTDPNLAVPQQQAVADYNGDGFQDLALSLGNGTWGLLSVRNGNGNGTFQAPVQYLVPPAKSSIGSMAIVSAQLNGDTRPDLVLGIVGASPGLTVLINTTGSAPPPTPTAPALISPAQDARPAQPVALDWSDVTGASSYRIQIDDSSSFSSPIVLDRTVTASQLTAPTLAARQHWWRVRAVNAAGTAGPWSTVRRFTPQAATTTPTLATLGISPTSAVAGTSVQSTATLSSAAPAGGLVVTLSSTNPSAATVPASVTVAAGATSATFPISTGAVTASTVVTITGAAGGVSRSATVTVTPATSPGQTATLTVRATGRSGERVSSNPTGISVSVGSTGSSSFSVGTTITLSATNGRDVVWSGACSSGGGKARSCTFTINGTASITADVQ